MDANRMTKQHPKLSAFPMWRVRNTHLKSFSVELVQVLRLTDHTVVLANGTSTRRSTLTLRYFDNRQAANNFAIQCLTERYNELHKRMALVTSLLDDLRTVNEDVEEVVDASDTSEDDDGLEDVEEA